MRRPRIRKGLRQFRWASSRPSERPIAKTLDFVGRVDAINRVEVRARVKGYLEAVLFKEGDLVKEGAAPLPHRKRVFQAAVEQAQGKLQTTKAQHELAVKNRERQAELYAKNVSAGKQLDEAVASEGEAKGAIMTSEADLQTAQINLGYTDIVAPIAGKIGRTALTKGNVVSPDSGVLTTIVSQDPMYVTFPVSQREFLRAHSDRPDDRRQKHQGANPIFRRIGCTTSSARSILST